MSTTATDLVRRWYESGDTGLLAEDVVWTVLDTFPNGGAYVGRVAVAERFFPGVKALFGAYVTELAMILSEEGAVVTTGVYRVRTLAGQAGEIAFAHVWTIRDGKIATFRQVADTAALRDLLNVGSAAS